MIRPPVPYRNPQVKVAGSLTTEPRIPYGIRGPVMLWGPGYASAAAFAAMSVRCCAPSRPMRATAV